MVSHNSIFSCGYEFGDVACVTCPLVENCPKRGKITPLFGAVARTFTKLCRKQPTTRRIKSCSECCAAREDDNLFFMAIRKAV